MKTWPSANALEYPNFFSTYLQTSVGGWAVDHVVAGILTVPHQMALRKFEPRIFDARIHAVAVGTPLIARESLAPIKWSESEKSPDPAAALQIFTQI